MKKILLFLSIGLLIGFTTLAINAENKSNKMELSKAVKSVQGYNLIQEDGFLTLQLCNGGSFTVSMRKVISITPTGLVCNNEPVLTVTYND